MAFKGYQLYFMRAEKIFGSSHTIDPVLVSYYRYKNHNKWLKTTQIYFITLLFVGQKYGYRVFRLNEGVGRGSFCRL